MRKCALQTTVQCTRQLAADGDMPASVGVIRTSGGHPTGPRAVAISSSPARIICASCRPSMHRQVEAASRKSGDLVLDPLLPTRSHANSDIASLCAGALPRARARAFPRRLHQRSAGAAPGRDTNRWKTRHGTTRTRSFGFTSETIWGLGSQPILCGVQCPSGTYGVLCYHVSLSIADSTVHTAAGC